MTGYVHSSYAQSLAEFGTPRKLSRCGGWILVRQIPGFPYHDAMGCYPLFCCQDWSQLHADLEDISDELVSLSLVTDPFGEYDPTYLHQCFGDVVIPFKKHLVIDLCRSIDDIVSKHHLYHARKALKKIKVELCKEPEQFLDGWMDLFSILIEKHNIKGIKALSRTAFAKQLSVPGMVVFRAVYQDKTVGGGLIFVQGEVAYGHMIAVNEVGYKKGAMYALYWSLIEHFSGKTRWLDIGSVPGIEDNTATGLNQFKRGWSTETRTAYFCGRIFDHQRYAEIVKAKGVFATSYFPAYRDGEFG